ncbi:MAG TPA: hypothetical protein VHG93_08245 [Longimicrobium sp.]|nr:hypothetical protein [Longimicrobium sp.]
MDDETLYPQEEVLEIGGTDPRTDPDDGNPAGWWDVFSGTWRWVTNPGTPS